MSQALLISNKVTVIREAWGLRDYKTEPIIFDGLPDCEHDFSIKIRRNNDKSGGHGNVEEGLASKICNAQDSVRFGEPTQLCSLCGAWRGQLGLEPTPELFIKHLLDFFDDVKLKLKDEGNCFVNLGDTYSGSGNGYGSIDPKNKTLCKSGAKNKPMKNNNLPAKCLCMDILKNNEWELRADLTEGELHYIFSELSKTFIVSGGV